MLKTGGLKKRELPPTPLQTQMREASTEWRTLQQLAARLGTLRAGALFGVQQILHAGPGDIDGNRTG
jgi:hypothetical protein